MRTRRRLRRVPVNRENTNDPFRVNYGDRSTFDRLIVTVIRLATGEQQQFEFNAAELSDSDSIHFSTAVVGGRFVVTWDGARQPRRIA